AAVFPWCARTSHPGVLVPAHYTPPRAAAPRAGRRIVSRRWIEALWDADVEALVAAVSEAVRPC
ncbi:hypothetical protein ACWELB_46675, partial [Streptomyces asiaticus]